LDFRGTVMPIRRATIIIHTGTTSGRTTLMPSRIRTITRARDTPGITGIGLLIATIAIIITTASELPQR
jgi:2-keto-3-deoxy-galactonokinase